MNKIFIFSLFLLSAMLVPGSADAQTSLFNFKASNKTQVTTPAPQAAPVVVDNTVDAEFSLSEIQSQPLHIRRQIVAAELGDIRLRLSVLSDKTKAAADRLAANGIATDAALTELSKTTLSLAEAQLSIDALTLAANDPSNTSATSLTVGTVPFKDAVIDVETKLRAARESIITALVSLKAAVSTSVLVE